MTSAAALPGAGAALRMVRGAAGRRLAQVALLVGGLFVLGVLCGERASAVEVAPTSRPSSATVMDVMDVTDVMDVAGVTGMVGHAVPPAGEHVVEPVAERVAHPVTGHVARPVAGRVVRPVTEEVVQPVTDPVLRPVTEHVVVPAGDLVESVTEGLAEAPSWFPPMSGWRLVPIGEETSRRGALRSR